MSTRVSKLDIETLQRFLITLEKDKVISITTWVNIVVGADVGSLVKGEAR